MLEDAAFDAAMATGKGKDRQRDKRVVYLEQACEWIAAGLLLA